MSSQQQSGANHTKQPNSQREEEYKTAEMINDALDVTFHFPMNHNISGGFVNLKKDHICSIEVLFLINSIMNYSLHLGMQPWKEDIFG